MPNIFDKDMLDRFCGLAQGEQPAPRVLVVVAHPDDEVLGLAGRLPYLPEVIIAHVTDGSPQNPQDALAAGFATREEYARARRHELTAALELAGIHPAQTREIGLVDQEASLYLAELTWTLAHLFRNVQPDVVVTHPYEGGHPDHDATAFAVHAACRLLERRGNRAPVVVEMTSYHNRGGEIAMCEFLPDADCETVMLPLTEEQRALKEQMIASFPSQQHMLRHYPVDREAFRVSPRYTFSWPPHEGVLYYELFDWGMKGDRWRALAGAVEEELGLRG